jgi:hypothetical protein
MTPGSAPDPHSAYRQQAAQHFGSAGPYEHPPQFAGSARGSGGLPVFDMSGTPGGGGPEHREIALLPGEETLFAADFTPFPILRHIKSGLVVTQRRVIVRHPQYFLFLIKTGFSESACPIERLNLVRVGRIMSRERLRTAGLYGGFGAVLLVSGLISMIAAPTIGLLTMLLGIPMAALGAFYFWLARHLALSVFNDSGTALHVDVDKREYQNMIDVSQLIQRLVLGIEPAANRESPAPVAAVAPAPPAWTPAAEQPTASFPQVPARPPSAGPSAPPSIFRG